LFEPHHGKYPSLGDNPKADLSVIHDCYKTIFGAWAGTALFEMSIASQKDSEFQIGRESAAKNTLISLSKKFRRLDCKGFYF
jgi:hypothetical protein